MKAQRPHQTLQLHQARRNIRIMCLHVLYTHRRVLRLLCQRGNDTNQPTTCQFHPPSLVKVCSADAWKIAIGCTKEGCLSTFQHRCLSKVLPGMDRDPQSTPHKIRLRRDQVMSALRPLPLLRPSSMSRHLNSNQIQQPIPSSQPEILAQPRAPDPLRTSVLRHVHQAQRPFLEIRSQYQRRKGLRSPRISIL